MIRINLLGDSLPADTSAPLYLAGYVASLVLLILICGGVSFYFSSAASEIELANEERRDELARLKTVTAEVRSLEGKRKELADKLAIIATLKRSKMGPVRVLDDLSEAMPAPVWLTEVKESGGTLRMAGVALDNNLIADLMRSMEESPYFKNVDLVETKQTMRDNVKVKSFSLQMKVDYAGLEAASGKKIEEVGTAQASVKTISLQEGGVDASSN